MQLLFLILADSAQIAEGKLYMLGGGWTKISPPTLPSQHLVSLAIGIGLSWDESDETHTFRLHLATPSGEAPQEVGGGEFLVGRPPGLPEGSEQSLIAAVPLTLQLQEPGRHEVRLSVDGLDIGNAGFWVVPRE